MDYRYDPLPTGRVIRLVTLVHDETACNGFRCQISVADLNLKPTYNTLSYTWGRPYDPDPLDPTEPSETPHSIDAKAPEVQIGDGQERLAVTKNLLDALCQLAKDADSEDDSTSPLKTPLWIDAISINQGDPAERSSADTLPRP